MIRWVLREFPGKRAALWRSFCCSEEEGERAAVVVERRGGVQLIGLNRPAHRNAVDPATARLLYQAFQRFNSDEGASVAVLYGLGGTFCAGYDLKQLAQAPEQQQSQLPKEIGGGASPMVS